LPQIAFIEEIWDGHVRSRYGALILLAATGVLAEWRGHRAVNSSKT
jgi:hypothetical protein